MSAWSDLQLSSYVDWNISPAQPYFSVPNTWRPQVTVIEGDNKAAIFLTAPDDSDIKSSSC